MAKPKQRAGSSRLQSVKIAERIKQSRLQLEITQEAMARKAGLSRSAYIHYEQGNTVPGGLELIKLARALGKSPNYLLSGSEAFFGRRTPDAMPPAETTEAAVYRFAMMLAMLDRETVEAFSSVALAIIRAKLTKRQFALIQKVWTKTDAALPALANQFAGSIEDFAEQMYPLKPKRKT